MKTIEEFKSGTTNSRAKDLVSRASKQAEAKKEIMKILIAGEECGDFGRGKGEMNTYAQKLTALDLRREIQGTYEGCNVLREIRSGKIAMTEKDFDSKPFGSFPLIMLSGFLGKSPEKVPEALEIIRSGVDVTKRLQALRGAGKPGKSAKENSTDSEKSAPEIQTPETPGGISYFVPDSIVILNQPEILARILSEVTGAATIDDCNAFISMFDKLMAHAESRREVLEAQAAKAAKPAKGKPATIAA